MPPLSPLSSIAALILAAHLAPSSVATDDAASWRTDRTWYDGQAEKCVYEATRTIYGQGRHYLATAYTNKELADPATTCKSESEQGIEVFKHHWSERVPTENYDYDFSTMTYTRTQDLLLFKLSAATQDDCGASYKEIWRDGSRLKWFESVYFPGGGRREGRFDPGQGEAAVDALTLVLRNFDFDSPSEQTLSLVPSQKDTHSVSFEPVARTLRYVGKSVLDLPIGKVDAHALELGVPGGPIEARYWFAADGSAPWLHVLVQYQGPQGVTYRLKSRERSAYWKRS